MRCIVVMMSITAYMLVACGSQADPRELYAAATVSAAQSDLYRDQARALEAQHAQATADAWIAQATLNAPTATPAPTITPMPTATSTPAPAMLPTEQPTTQPTPTASPTAAPEPSRPRTFADDIPIIIVLIGVLLAGLIAAYAIPAIKRERIEPND